MEPKVRRVVAGVLLVLGMVLVIYGFAYAQRALGSFDVDFARSPGSWTCETVDGRQECNAPMVGHLADYNRELGRSIFGCAVFVCGTMTALAGVSIGMRARGEGVSGVLDMRHS